MEVEEFGGHTSLTCEGIGARCPVCLPVSGTAPRFGGRLSPSPSDLWLSVDHSAEGALFSDYIGAAVVPFLCDLVGRGYHQTPRAIGT